MNPMDRVNLLPDEARLTTLERWLQVVDRNFPRVLAGSLGAVVAVGILISMGQAFMLVKGKKELKVLTKEMELLRVEIQNMESFAKQLDQVQQELERQEKSLKERIAYLDQASQRPRIWAKTLRELRRNIPTGVWLTEMETGPGNRLRIAGGAMDESQVTQFMANLKASPGFTDVGFNYTEKDAIGAVAIVKFEVVCRVL